MNINIRISGISEIYRAVLSQEIKKGLMENARNCRSNGGHSPLGYDIDPATKRYVVNETEAAIVRTVFRLFNKGYRYSSIAHELNAQGHKTKGGNLFGRGTVRAILSNEKYAGVYVYRAKGQNSDSDETIRVENGVPTIISKKDFEKAHEHVKTNR